MEIQKESLMKFYKWSMIMSNDDEVGGNDFVWGLLEFINPEDVEYWSFHMITTTLWMYSRLQRPYRCSK